MHGYRVAVLGATGLVGSALLAGLSERDFPVSEVIAAASGSGGRWVRMGERSLPVQQCTPAGLAGMDLVFNCAGRAAAEAYLPSLAGAGTLCVDKSTAFRARCDVPLVIPEVNGDQLRHHCGIVASPNCVTIQLAVALAPLHRALGLRRVVVSTYQSISGAGREALELLQRETEASPCSAPRRLAGNVIAGIGDMDSNGHSGEERKIAAELQRILPGGPAAAVTAVRVPVEIGHCTAVWCEPSTSVTAERVREILAEAPGVTVASGGAGYCTPREVAGSDEVHVGRIRTDGEAGEGFWLWVVSDNLRKGAATNALQIAEELVRCGE